MDNLKTSFLSNTVEKKGRGKYKRSPESFDFGKVLHYKKTPKKVSLKKKQQQKTKPTLLHAQLSFHEKKVNLQGLQRLDRPPDWQQVGVDATADLTGVAEETWREELASLSNPTRLILLQSRTKALVLESTGCWK